MGQGFDSDRPQRDSAARLPPVAPPPRKISNASLPEMSVFRGLAGSSSPPQGAFGPLPQVSPPKAPTGRPLPSVSAPPAPQPRIVPPASASRDPFVDSVTKVKSPIAADTFRDVPHGRMSDAVTHPASNGGASHPLDWDEDEESTHVFASSHPPPVGESGAAAYPHVSTARGLGPSGDPMNQPPTTDTMRLDQHGAPAGTASSVPPPPRNGQSGMMFPPPPPIPSITQARPMEQSVPGITAPVPVQAQEIVRDQPFVRLPHGNPHTATELAIRKPTLPSTYVPPTMLGTSSLPSPSYAPLPTMEVRRDSKRWILAVAALAALLSIGALVTFLFTRRPGGVQVEVTDASGASVPKAEVYVDGRKVCDATPCSVRDLEVGRHSVRVITPSEEPLEPMSVDVEPGSMSPLNFKLKPQLATLVAASDQPGLRLWVDGTDRGALPAKLTDLPPGKHELKLAGDRFKTFEKSIDVRAGETLELEVPKLKVLKGRATVNVKTEGVSITIVRTDEKSSPKILDGPFPRTIEVDTTGRWQLIAKKKSLPDFTAVLDFPDGMPERTIDVELTDEKKDEKKEPEPTSVASLPNNPSPTSPIGRPTPTPAEPKRVDPPATPEPAPAASGTGTLNINSIPASRVLLDGAPLGETPKTGVSVSAGTHTVTFIHPELGKKSVTVKVGPGETKTASARLRAD